ncbi:SDR family oxidoreductase [Amycolatopsis sp. cmx-11-12]|uniref:SDR family oxidoreductase n=1 Tax=Amycolatopsis sp. cmx-11-12 TaxID=2785795 RepID=UPI00391831F1
MVTAIEDSGGRAVAVAADVTDTGQLRGLLGAAEWHYGGVDIVVSNVGLARFSPIADASDTDYDLIFTTNTRSAFMALHEAANRVRDGGWIVVVSSGAAVTYRPGTGVYSASKAVGDALVRVLAKEFGPRGITVNSVLPGATRTLGLTAHQPPGMRELIAAQTPLGRLGEPDDIAEIVAFPASDAARWSPAGPCTPAAAVLTFLRSQAKSPTRRTLAGAGIESVEQDAAPLKALAGQPNRAVVSGTPTISRVAAWDQVR